MNVPFVDLQAQYQTIKAEIDGAIRRVIADAAFVGGKYVEEFEAQFASRYGVSHCIGTANGTDAIYIALKMLGIGKGDEVITVANSWISTSEMITQTGAIPVFVDIEPDYYTIDVSKIEERITNKTKAIIPVHLFGHPADLDPILDLCGKYKLRLLEDCAQAHFAEYKGKRVGLFGDVATFSFYPGKNLGAYGDAGCIITNNDDLANRCRMFANHGSLVKHQHEIEGINSRLDGLQAAVLSAKLPHILDWTAMRRRAADWYREHLSDSEGIALPPASKYVSHVYHLFVIRVKDRESVQNRLTEWGIGSGIHYPRPLPLLKAYEYLGYKDSDLPVAAGYSDQILSLPMYPELSKESVKYIAEALRKT